MARVAQTGHSGRYRGAFEQHILTKLGQTSATRFMPQRLSHAPDRLTLTVSLFTIGKSREQRDGEDGLLLWEIHGRAVFCGGLNGARTGMVPQLPERFPANPIIAPCAF